MGDLWLFVTKCSAAIAGSYKLATALFDAHTYHRSLVFKWRGANQSPETYASLSDGSPVRTAGNASHKGRVSMRPNYSSSVRSNNPLLMLATLVLLAQPSSKAVAGDLLGLYVGGAIGQSRVEGTETACQCDLFQEIVTEKFDKTHLAFKGVLGARPISLVGAEIDYIDFGKPDGQAFGFPASASIKGVAAFGVLYLPVPVVNIYLKAGVARLESTVKYSYCGPCACNFCLNSIQLDRTNTSGVGGLGAQYKFGSWAVRAEFERFNAAGE